MKGKCDAKCTGVCPVETTLKVIGGKWKILILFHLHDGAKRFSELRRAMPMVTEKMLTKQLKELTKDGVISRKVYPQVPPKVEYSVTRYGNTLHPIIHAMCRWGLEHTRRNGKK